MKDLKRKLAVLLTLCLVLTGAIPAYAEEMMLPETAAEAVAAEAIAAEAAEAVRRQQRKRPSTALQSTASETKTPYIRKHFNNVPGLYRKVFMEKRNDG